MKITIFLLYDYLIKTLTKSNSLKYLTPKNKENSANIFIKMSKSFP
ncbi:hypothetical protein DDI_2455 [Dickeya dianthicola RNS04.9]|nr:hypothetical protein DDI_2455 [Dickeya dianthicola RNS04.9]